MKLTTSGDEILNCCTPEVLPDHPHQSAGTRVTLVLVGTSDESGDAEHPLAAGTEQDYSLRISTSDEEVRTNSFCQNGGEGTVLRIKIPCGCLHCIARVKVVPFCPDLRNTSMSKGAASWLPGSFGDAT